MKKQKKKKKKTANVRIYGVQVLNKRNANYILNLKSF